MSRIQFFALALTFVAALSVRVNSQDTGLPKTPLQQVQSMKAVNQTILEKQTALLLTLDEVHKQATQIKFLSKRG